MNKKTIVQGVLSQDAFVMVNKRIARFAGFIEAGILGELLATHKMCDEKINNNDFFKGGELGEWFYLTQPTIEANLGIKRKQFDNAIKNLESQKMIEKKMMGLPAKNYYLINWDLIFDVMSDINFGSKKEKKSSETLIQSGCTKRTTKDVRKGQSRFAEKDNQGLPKGTSIKTSNNINLKNQVYNNQSISKNPDLDSLIKMVFGIDLKQDRIDTIHKIYDLFSEELDLYTYKTVLLQVEGNISKIKTNFERYLKVAVQNAITPKDEKSSNNKPKRSEMVPSWLNEEENDQQSELDREQFELEKKKLFDRIKNYKDKKDDPVPAS